MQHFLPVQTTDSAALVAARDVEFGGTVLHWAAAAGDEEIVRLLLLKGADTRVRVAAARTRMS